MTGVIISENFFLWFSIFLLFLSSIVINVGQAVESEAEIVYYEETWTEIMYVAADSEESPWSNNNGQNVDMSKYKKQVQTDANNRSDKKKSNDISSKKGKKNSSGSKSKSNEKGQKGKSSSSEEPCIESHGQSHQAQREQGGNQRGQGFGKKYRKGGEENMSQRNKRHHHGGKHGKKCKHSHGSGGGGGNGHTDRPGSTKTLKPTTKSQTIFTTAKTQKTTDHIASKSTSTSSSKSTSPTITASKSSTGKSTASQSITREQSTTPTRLITVTTTYSTKQPSTALSLQHTSTSKQQSSHSTRLSTAASTPYQTTSSRVSTATVPTIASTARTQISESSSTRVSSFGSNTASSRASGSTGQQETRSTSIPSTLHDISTTVQFTNSGSTSNGMTSAQSQSTIMQESTLIGSTSTQMSSTVSHTGSSTAGTTLLSGTTQQSAGSTASGSSSTSHMSESTMTIGSTQSSVSTAGTTILGSTSPVDTTVHGSTIQESTLSDSTIIVGSTQQSLSSTGTTIEGTSSVTSHGDTSVSSSITNAVSTSQLTDASTGTTVGSTIHFSESTMTIGSTQSSVSTAGTTILGSTPPVDTTVHGSTIQESTLSDSTIIVGSTQQSQSSTGTTIEGTSSVTSHGDTTLYFITTNTGSTNQLTDTSTVTSVGSTIQTESSTATTTTQAEITTGVDGGTDIPAFLLANVVGGVVGSVGLNQNVASNRNANQYEAPDDPDETDATLTPEEQVADNELENTNSLLDEANTPFNLFDNHPLQKCNEDIHPVIKVVRYLKKNDMYKEYKDHMCNVDYDDACSSSGWSQCQTNGALTFCPKTCKLKECSSIRDYGKDEKHAAKYVPAKDCIDDPKYDCAKLEESGHCLVANQKIGLICPKTCGLCEHYKPYAPFMHEEHKLTRWMGEHNNGILKRFVIVMKRRKRILKRKITRGHCVDNRTQSTSKTTNNVTPLSSNAINTSPSLSRSSTIPFSVKLSLPTLSATLFIPSLSYSSSTPLTLSSISGLSSHVSSHSSPSPSTSKTAASTISSLTSSVLPLSVSTAEATKLASSTTSSQSSISSTTQSTPSFSSSTAGLTISSSLSTTIPMGSPSSSVLSTSSALPSSASTTESTTANAHSSMSSTSTTIVEITTGVDTTYGDIVNDPAVVKFIVAQKVDAAPVMGSILNDLFDSKEDPEPPPLDDEGNRSKRDLDDTNSPSDESETLSNTFDGQPLKKCGNEIHPIIKAVRFMKKKNIYYDEYQKKQCDVDYHSECSGTWASCRFSGAAKFCPKTCANNKCSAIKSFGRSLNEQPIYVNDKDCKNDPHFDCQSLVKAGHCFVSPRGMGRMCSKACGFCKMFQPYAPFMAEEERLCRWLDQHDNGRYKKYAEAIRYEKSELRRKIMKKQCEL